MTSEPKGKDRDDYLVDFKGAKLTQLEANRISIGILFGILGIAVVFFLPIESKSVLSYGIIFLSVIIGYFVVAPRLFRKKHRTRGRP
jgi:hypothetical protein